MATPLEPFPAIPASLSYSLGQLTSHLLNGPSFGKGKTKVSRLISFHSLVSNNNNNNNNSRISIPPSVVTSEAVAEPVRSRKSAIVG